MPTQQDYDALMARQNLESDWSMSPSAQVVKDTLEQASILVYYPRLGSPFTLPHAIAAHRGFKHPLDAVIWFGLMVRRAEMLTKQRLWSKAMQRRAKVVVEAQGRALKDWQEASDAIS